MAETDFIVIWINLSGFSSVPFNLQAPQERNGEPPAHEYLIMQKYVLYGDKFKDKSLHYMCTNCIYKKILSTWWSNRERTTCLILLCNYYMHDYLCTEWNSNRKDIRPTMTEVMILAFANYDSDCRWWWMTATMTTTWW